MVKCLWNVVFKKVISCFISFEREELAKRNLHMHSLLFGDEIKKEQEQEIVLY